MIHGANRDVDETLALLIDNSLRALIMKNSKLMVTLSTAALSFGAINTLQEKCKPKPFSSYIKRLLVTTLILSNLTACVITTRHQPQKISYAYGVDESIDKHLLSLKHADNETIQYDKQREVCGSLSALLFFIPVPLLYRCYTYSEAKFENGKPVMLTKVTIKETSYICDIPALIAMGFRSVCAEVQW